MLVGDAGLRERKGMQKQLCHRCLGAEYDQGGAPCTGSDSVTLPTGFCAGGMSNSRPLPLYGCHMLARHPLCSRTAPATPEPPC
jgi:hypothetical protein